MSHDLSPHRKPDMMSAAHSCGLSVKSSWLEPAPTRSSTYSHDHSTDHVDNIMRGCRVGIIPPGQLLWSNSRAVVLTVPSYNTSSAGISTSDKMHFENNSLHAPPVEMLLRSTSFIKLNPYRPKWRLKDHCLTSMPLQVIPRTGIP